jgi:hypothetical protein
VTRADLDAVIDRAARELVERARRTSDDNLIASGLN